jgi:hypothetical protein
LGLVKHWVVLDMGPSGVSLVSFIIVVTIEPGSIEVVAARRE